MLKTSLNYHFSTIYSLKGRQVADKIRELNPTPSNKPFPIQFQDC